MRQKPRLGAMTSGRGAFLPAEEMLEGWAGSSQQEDWHSRRKEKPELTAHSGVRNSLVGKCGKTQKGRASTRGVREGRAMNSGEELWNFC